MDQDLKHRLIGIVVVTSLAAIFVPMLFEDPVDGNDKMISELKIPETRFNTLHKDFTSFPKSMDEVIQLPEPSAIKEQINRQKSVGNKLVWYIQVGIFGQESNAVSLQHKLRKQGFPGVISEVENANGLMFRVRVGPELDKKRAEAMKRKIDKLNNLKGILTSIAE